MKYITGFLIRRNRLLQNLSQEGLCKGICAVSYLSKIEQGHVEPSPEIVDQLFRALGIRYEQDEHFLSEMREALRTYFDAYFHGEDAAQATAQIDAAGERLENSALYIAHELCVIARMQRAGEGAYALERLRALKAFEAYMDTGIAFVYAMQYCGHVPVTDAEWYQGIERARALIPCSVSVAAEANYWYHHGKYPQALLHFHHGYQLAVEEGNITEMRSLSFLEASCYANLLNPELMLRAFQRTRALYRGDVNALASIEYNIGASFLEMRRYDEAVRHLLASLKGLGKKQHDLFLAYHKLALAYGELGREREGRKYLEKAEKQVEGLPWFYGRIYEVLRLRYTEDYLDSDAYLDALKDVYDHIMEHFSFGFKQFHGFFLMEAYAHRRKYKEALAVSREIGKRFS